MLKVGFLTAYFIHQLVPGDCGRDFECCVCSIADILTNSLFMSLLHWIGAMFLIKLSYVAV